MTAPNLEDRDLQHLRMLASQMARDAQALADAIPAEGGRPAYEAAAGTITPAIANFGELIHLYFLFWEGATEEERLDSWPPPS